MPRYTYCCEECGITFQKAHSIKEKLTDCEECNTEGCLKRGPSMAFVFSNTGRPGKVVKDHIETAKQELQEEKQAIREEEYE